MVEHLSTNQGSWRFGFHLALRREEARKVIENSKYSTVGECLPRVHRALIPSMTEKAGGGVTSPGFWCLGGRGKGLRNSKSFLVIK